ncbi:FlgD immunoglobulin-like domain containing protein [candidate division KSB1 bacterium]
MSTTMKLTVTQRRFGDRSVAALIFLFCLTATAAVAQDDILSGSLTLTPTFECIGIRVSYSGDNNQNGYVNVRYRPVGSGDWKNAQSLNRILNKRFAGSIFYLEPGTEYEVELDMVDADGVTNGLQTGTTTTRAFDFPSGTRDLYVAPNGSDLATGTEENPFQTIGKAEAISRSGDVIHVLPGIYRETVRITRSGGATAYIAYRAEGDGVILDGADPVFEYVDTVDNWGAVSNGVYRANIDYQTGYVGVHDHRLYHYESLSALGDLEVGPPGGWYQDPSTKRLYVKLTSGDDPDARPMEVAKLNYGFNMTSTHHVIIDGFEIRYFGGDSRGRGIYMDSANNNVIENCLIHGVMEGVLIRRNIAENNLIRDNTIYDTSIYNWDWDDVKAHEEENSAISSSGGGGNVIKGNTIFGFFNGIAPAVWSELGIELFNHDMDIYENEVYNIGDDCLEPEGTCINIRFWGNWLHDSFCPISIAPITLGPCYIMRNVIFNYKYTAFKYNVNAPVTTRGPCLIYHNSICVPADGINGIVISPTSVAWSYQRYRNNVFFATRYAMEDMMGPGPGLSFDYNTWFTSSSTSYIKWNDTRYSSLAEFRAATGHEAHGLGVNPWFVDYQGGNLRLRSNSACIDAGQRMANINDGYAGSAPDMGAFEYGAARIARDDSETAAVPAFELFQNYPNPANPQTIIPFNLNKEGQVRLDIYNIRGQLVRRLVDGQLSSGTHRILWDGKDGSGHEVASGVYFYRLENPDNSKRAKSLSRKLLILR